MHLPGGESMEVSARGGVAVPSHLLGFAKMHCPGWSKVCVQLPSGSEALKFHH